MAWVNVVAARKALKSQRTTRGGATRSNPKAQRRQRRIENNSPALAPIAPKHRPPGKTVKELEQARLALEDGDFRALDAKMTTLINKTNEQLVRAEQYDPDAVSETKAILDAHKKEHERLKQELEKRFGEEALFRTHERAMGEDGLYVDEYRSRPSSDTEHDNRLPS